MIDFRLYRVAWLPAIAAFVTLMFSLEGAPEPFEPAIAPTEFDADRAETNVRQILRSSGDAGDGADPVAGLITQRFREVEAGTTAEQPLDDGEAGEAQRNVILTLPGESDQVILVAAARDAATGPGAPTTAAATGTLLELAEVVGGADHTKTFVFVSVAGSADGARGMREFIDTFAARDLVEAAVVITQPGFAEPRSPYVLRHSTDDRSTSIGLVRTAEAAITEQAELTSPGGGPFSDLARLAMPVAVGEQAVLIAEGLDAVAISSAGEAPLAEGENGEDQFDPERLAQFGSATLDLFLALDQSLQPLEHGPETYVQFEDSLVPGWAIAVLALAFILPAAVAALDGLARGARRRAGVVRGVAWALGLALPLLGALIALYLLAVVGIVADPAYPFDPAAFDTGFGERLLIGALVVLTAAAYAVGGLARRPRRTRPDALVPALGVAAAGAGLLIWALNPYLALLVAPATHAWLAAARGGRPSRPVVTIVVVLALVPLVLAYRSTTGAVDAGAWDVMLMVADGHIPTLTLIALMPVLATLVGALILAWRPAKAQERRSAPLGGRPQDPRGTAQGISAAASIDSAAR